MDENIKKFNHNMKKLYDNLEILNLDQRILLTSERSDILEVFVRIEELSESLDSTYKVSKKLNKYRKKILKDIEIPEWDLTDEKIKEK